jgi:hypothetical protein
VILPPLVFPGSTIINSDWNIYKTFFCGRERLRGCQTKCSTFKISKNLFFIFNLKYGARLFRHLDISSTWHFVKWNFVNWHCLNWSRCLFKWSFCQIIILSIVILSNDHFVSFSFCYLVLLSVSHFVISSFCS